MTWSAWPGRPTSRSFSYALFNNAGVGFGGARGFARGRQWVISVNLWGVVHGLRAFVPLMLAGGTSPTS